MPLDFVAIDFETANWLRGSPCAVGLARVEGGRIVDSGSMLIHQDFFDPFNILIHGITPEDVEDAPSFSEAWPTISQAIGGLPIVAHNAAFDTGVIRDALELEGTEWPRLSYACTLTMGRRTYDLPSYRLPFVAEAAGIPFDEGQHHKADYDALLAAQIMLDLVRRNDASDLSDLASKLGMALGWISPEDWSGCKRKRSPARPGHRLAISDIKVNTEADPDNPFYGVGITFTGALSSMTRALAWDRVSRLGGQPLESVTRKTNLLVFGYQDAAVLAPGATTSNKFKKAVDLKSKGQDIEIIGEEDFVAMLQEAGLGAAPPEVPT